ncbi:hypothetical protein WI41_21915 [Burkholderia latens]|uniref:Uncharacterized protein n=1 Tax=Burkholderia latens TaxID=488446 RepID=A0AAP1G6W9_9BURK|nr:hypothetical protein WK25_25005 [Burkholderia latens]KVA04735.1 hypothetical protein WI41_21915 [Burkholderia latens]
MLAVRCSAAPLIAVANLRGPNANVGCRMVLLSSHVGARAHIVDAVRATLACALHEMSGIH